MIEAYAVGVELNLLDLVSVPLARISAKFAELEIVTGALNKNLKALGVEGAGLRGLADSSKTLERHLAAANLQTERLEKNMAAIKALGMGSTPGVNPAVVIPGRGGRGGYGGRGMHVGPGGVGMSAATIGLGEAAIPLAVGAASIYGAHSLYEAASDYQMAFERFRSLNLGEKINREADEFSRGAHRFGVSSTELMSVLAESVGLFGNFEEARKFAPKITELAKANAAIFGNKFGPLDEHGMMGLIKFIDRRGGFKDDASFGKNLDLAERLITGSGGRIKFSDLDTFSQRGGTAFRSMSDEGIMGMAGLIIEQGGSAAGVASMSLFQNLVSGRASKRSLALMAELGLGDLKQVEYGKMGQHQIKTTVLKNLKESALLQENPREWFNKVLMPTLAENGITEQTDVVRTINDLLSNRTASNQATIYTAQSLQLQRDYNLVKGSRSANDVIGAYKKTGHGAEADFTAAWTDFKREFGKSVLPAVTDMLKGGAAMFRAIGSFGESMEKSGMGKVLRFFAKNLPGVNTAGIAMDSLRYAGGDHGDKKMEVNMDGQKVGEIVTGHQARDAERPTSGVGRFDSRMSLVQHGATGGF